MSFSVPRNVPSFNNAQRGVEDGYWMSSGILRGPNGHASNGIGGRLDKFFDKRQLPMYKDKPYNYAASARNSRWYQKRRNLGGAVLIILGLAYWYGVLSSAIEVAPVASRVTTSWSWGGKATNLKADWNDRREKVKDAFVISWDGYEKHAWGYDEYHPVSKKGNQMTPKGVGWIIVDALDTLMIMNLTSRLSHAREWISTTLDYDQDNNVNTFETTIRMLGGLLSAHYLSTTFPDMAPVADDDHGTPGEDLYLEKAADLADRILGAFDSESGVPFASVNLKEMKGVPSHVDGGASSTAEAASLQLEFKYLAMLTGEKNFWEKAERVIQVIDDNGMEDGLVPIFIYPDDGQFRGSIIRLGSRGDSYYEYLIKQYIQTSGQEPIYLELWEQALAGVQKHLITYSLHSNFTIIGERPHGLGGQLSAKMDHLVCFMPGTIALAATLGSTVEEAKKHGLWGDKEEAQMKLAAELTKTCWGMYKVMATGLAPEISFFQINDPPRMQAEVGILASAELAPDDQDAPWRTDYQIKPHDSHNLQRPETVESLFYMWRITGDESYRELGWEMFTSFIRHTAVNDGTGFSSLANANEVPPPLRDNMESFWLAETLKYFYLLFSPPDLLPLDQIVLNTEAHVFPRFELARGLKTGWARKARDSQGKIIKDVKHEKVEEGTKDGAPGKVAVLTKTQQEVHTIQLVATQEGQNEKEKKIASAGL